MKLKFTDKETELLFEILILAMEDMMSLNSQNKVSKTPIFTEEENNHLHECMDFTALLMKKIRHS